MAIGTAAATAEAADGAGRRARLVGIALMCGTVVCFSGLDTSAKWLGRQGLDPLTITWARYAVSMVLIALFLNPVRKPALLRTSRPVLQLVRSALLFGSTIFNFFALRHLQLSESVTIQFATPLLVALVAGPMLGEWVGPRRLAAIAVGFLGVVVAVRPGFDGVQPAVLLCLANVVCYAFYILITRQLAAHDSTATTTLFSGLFGLVALTPILPFVWTAPASPLAWIVLLGTGAFGALGHWLLILAHARAPAAILAPFIYTQIIWMLVLGFGVFGDVPGPWTLAGAAIVVASGLYLLGRERVRGVVTKAAPSA